MIRCIAPKFRNCKGCMIEPATDEGPRFLQSKMITDLVNRRNKTMHGSLVNFDLEWPEMAEYLLFLFRMRPAFATALEECLQKQSNQV